MKQLSTKPIERTYYVNSDVIYDIKCTTEPTTDTHAVIYKKDGGKTFPYLYYMDTNGIEHTFYLDSLIEDGDKLSENAFKKVCHEISEEPEKTPALYFKYLCELQIAKVITNKYGRDYEYWSKNLNLLGVPEYMFKQNYDKLINGNNFRVCDGEQVNWIQKDSIELIDFSEETYNTLLEDEILRRAKEAANNAVYNYNKKVKTLTLEDE